jgi:hypothetical protein
MMHKIQKEREPAETWTWIRTDIKRMAASGMSLLWRTEGKIIRGRRKQKMELILKYLLFKIHL